MVRLVNGRGQLGKALKDATKPDIDCVIYHTWNIDDSSNMAQQKEYDKFIKFVDSHKTEKIFFISTKQGKQIHYLHYKLKAELYIIENIPEGHIIRIPKLIGKGLCADFRDEKILPFNELEEIITPEDAATEIINLFDTKDVMNVINGTILPKKTIYDLIRFGKANES